MYAVALGRVGNHDVIVSGSYDATVRIWRPARPGETLVQDTLAPVYAVAAHGGLVALATGRAVCTAYLS